MNSLGVRKSYLASYNKLPAAQDLTKMGCPDESHSVCVRVRTRAQMHVSAVGVCVRACDSVIVFGNVGVCCLCVCAGVHKRVIYLKSFLIFFLFS